MVKLNKIYTRTGDDGSTGLATGARVEKHDLRVTAYGEVDETNAFVGYARLAVADVLRETFGRIQNDLFDVGADLATPGPDDALAFTPLRASDAQVAWLESEIDRLNADLEPLSSFILPGGSEASARLHLARTVCRRAERAACALLEREPEAVNGAAVRYLNRLSDLLFVAARWVNDKGNSDTLWVPGENR